MAGILIVAAPLGGITFGTVAGIIYGVVKINWNSDLWTETGNILKDAGIGAGIGLGIGIIGGVYTAKELFNQTETVDKKLIANNTNIPTKKNVKPRRNLSTKDSNPTRIG